ncbi:MAG: hypothetical protein K8U57_01880 [Planctomycetes bacterium]|nr:hypothetical protein [Planctomycetota bacterium]
MPRQNRVTPLGEIVAVPERGTFMGNRGVLHDSTKTIRRSWQLKRWILCVTEFKHRKRTIMTPGRYTELFFLDEATGLAAGHRPCAECQRQRFLEFRDAWLAGNPQLAGGKAPTAIEIDEQLHAERLNAGGEQMQFEAALDGLPDGVLVTLDAEPDRAFLVWREELFAWSPSGYRHRRPRPTGTMVSVITPLSTVTAIRAGYVPAIHKSVSG